jgi:hypothetical protein
MQTALGFRVKSGRASAVQLAGSSESPRLVSSQIIALCDDQVPESRQPYHAVMKVSPSESAQVEMQLREIVHSAARRSIDELLRSIRDSKGDLVGAALVVGSNSDPSRIANPHIRAHALEGRLFRLAIEEPLRSNGIRYAILIEREAYRQAGEMLNLEEATLKSALIQLGRSHQGPWRADEKLAALAAWVAIGSQPVGS